LNLVVILGSLIYVIEGAHSGFTNNLGASTGQS